MQCNTAPYIIGHGKHRPCKNRAETVHPWLTKQKSHEIFRSTASTVDIPTRWDPRAKQQPTGLIAYGAMRRRPVRVPSIAQTKKKNQHTMCTGFSWCDGRGSNKAAAHSAASKATVRLCLARGSQSVGMSTVEAVDRKISWLFCFVSHGCTVFARWVLSMSDDVGRCIALQSVPFFASGEQC